MDPLSISVSVTALVGVCYQTVQLIQRTVETVKNAGKLLIKLLSQTESLRLILEQLRGLTKQLGAKAGLLLSFNDSGPKITINELNSLVKSVAEKKNFMPLQMLLNKGKVDALVERMKGHEAEVLTVLLSVATASAVRTEIEILRMHEESKVQSQVVTVFEGYFAPTQKASPKSPEPIKTLQIWFGDTYREGFSEKYLALRDALSDASYYGDFDNMLKTLRLARDTYGESWANAPRLHKQLNKTSGWTPLHQAVYMGASKTIVQELINLGASKTLRTSDTNPMNFIYRDVTALEIAQGHGWTGLFEILCPVIRNTVPHSTLEKLQRSFHNMIWDDLDSFPNQRHLRLPELASLTEMEVPEMWFPLKALDQQNQDPARGYFYRLDGRELVVKASRVKDVDDSRLYRITTSETREIVEGVIFNTNK